LKADETDSQTQKRHKISVNSKISYSGKKKSALLLDSVETPDPIQDIWALKTVISKNDFHPDCIFLLYLEPGSIALAIKEDLQSCRL